MIISNTVLTQTSVIKDKMFSGISMLLHAIESHAVQIYGIGLTLPKNVAKT